MLMVERLHLDIQLEQVVREFLVSLIHEMQKRDSQYGLATLCVGGGQGVATIVEKA